MTPYHGLPITPGTAARQAVQAGHAFVRYGHCDQLGIAIEVCKSFAVDNGAFSAWTAGRPVTDWSGYYAWASDLQYIPHCDFAVIPDVIDGSEADNDALLAEWPLSRVFGAPVWHMHESLDRLARLVCEYPRVCLGSSGDFSVVGNPAWWARMSVCMTVACDPIGRPLTKLHGLRMLNPRVFTRLPLASADSTNIGRNVGIDANWKGTYQPMGPGHKDVRAAIMRSRIETHNAPARWSHELVPS